MIDFLGLRQDILNALGDLIGVYQFPAGGSAPAIAVLPDPDYGYSYPPPGTQIEGLEVVIVPDTDTSVAPLLGRARQWQSSTQITLKQWDTNADTVAATWAIVGVLSNDVKVGPRILPLTQLGNIESRKITFTNTYLKRNT